MPVRIIYLILLIACTLLAGAQVTTERLRQFYQQLDSSINKASGNCKTALVNFKTDLSALPVEDLNKSLQRLHQVNSNLKNANNVCALFSNEVKNIDSFFVVEEKLINRSVDSLVLLAKILFLKYRASGYRLIDIHFNPGINQSVPALTVLSAFPSVLQQLRVDSTILFQWYVVPGAAYALHMNEQGYQPFSVAISSTENDSAIIIPMQILNKNNNVTATDNSGTVKEKNWNPFLWVSILLALFLLVLLIKMLRQNKSRQRSSDAFAQIHDPIIVDKRTEQASFKSSTNHTEKHFLSEIMMTAGPRKKPMNQPDADVDLGEDVCGFVTGGKTILMWLLDGTSDLHCLRNPSDRHEYFSSRLLAQSIARKLKSCFYLIEKEPMNHLMSKIIHQVKEDWTCSIQHLPQTEKDFLFRNIRDGNFPECAATILVAKLTLDGFLTTYRSGDCKMFMYRNDHDSLTYLPSPLSSKNVKSNDRIFFRLIITENNELDIVYNQPLYEIVEESNIQSVISLSDGVGAITESTLKNEYALNPDKAREKLSHQLQGTEDDKSLCIIEIKQTNSNSAQKITA